MAIKAHQAATFINNNGPMFSASQSPNAKLMAIKAGSDDISLLASKYIKITNMKTTSLPALGRPRDGTPSRFCPS